jgi:hypothetical protein
VRPVESVSGPVPAPASILASTATSRATNWKDHESKTNDSGKGLEVIQIRVIRKRPADSSTASGAPKATTTGTAATPRGFCIGKRPSV